MDDMDICEVCGMECCRFKDRTRKGFIHIHGEVYEKLLPEHQGEYYGETRDHGFRVFLIEKGDLLVCPYLSDDMKSCKISYCPPRTCLEFIRSCGKAKQIVAELPLFIKLKGKNEK